MARVLAGGGEWLLQPRPHSGKLRAPTLEKNERVLVQVGYRWPFYSLVS